VLHVCLLRDRSIYQSYIASIQSPQFRYQLIRRAAWRQRRSDVTSGQCL